MNIIKIGNFEIQIYEDILTNNSKVWKIDIFEENHFCLNIPARDKKDVEERLELLRKALAPLE